MGSGEFWITIDFKPIGQFGDLADANFLVSGFSSMEPAINFTRDGNVSVHLKFEGIANEDAELIAQQRLCSVLSPSRYRFVRVKSAPAINNPVGGCFGAVEFRAAAERLVTRRKTTGRLVGTLAFIDIVGSTRLIAELGDEPWKHLLEEFRTRTRAIVANSGGHELKTTGDGFLLYWPGLNAARAIEAMVRTRDRVAELGIKVRVGAHWGEFQSITNDVAGIEVHAASRVISHAAPNQILVTGSVLDLLPQSDFHLGLTKALPLRDVIPELWYLTEIVNLNR
jgi:class 3 adenylate cyclase